MLVHKQIPNVKQFSALSSIKRLRNSKARIVIFTRINSRKYLAFEQLGNCADWIKHKAHDPPHTVQLNKIWARLIWILNRILMQCAFSVCFYGFDIFCPEPWTVRAHDEILCDLSIFAAFVKLYSKQYKRAKLYTSDDC